MPTWLPCHTPSSARKTRPAVTGWWWWWWWWWNGTPFLPCISLSPSLVAFFPVSLIVPTTPYPVSLPVLLSLCLQFLRVRLPPFSLPFSRFPPDLLPTFLISLRLLSFPTFFPHFTHFLSVRFPPFSLSLSQLLSIGLPISQFLFSHFLLDRPHSFLISLQSRLLSCPTFSPLFLHFLWVRFSPFPFPFSLFLLVDFPISSFPFSHFPLVSLTPSFFLCLHFLWVGFLPLFDTFPSSFFCSSTCSAFHFFSRSIHPSHSTPVSEVNTTRNSLTHFLGSSSQDMATKNTHSSPDTLAIFIDPLDQSATSTQALPFFRVGGTPLPPPLRGPPVAPT